MQVRQSTARTIVIGPILDADGVAKTDEVVASVKIHKNGAAAAALNGSATLTHSQTGFYLLALTANDLDTLGAAEFSLNSGTNSMPIKSVNVLTALAWDALHHASDGVIRSNVTQLGGSTTPVTNMNTVFDTDFATNYNTTNDQWSVTLANGVTHGGSTAKLQLGSTTSTPAFLVENSGGTAVSWRATGGNNDALSLEGFGTGNGLYVTSPSNYAAWFYSPAGSGILLDGTLDVTGDVTLSALSITGITDFGGVVNIAGTLLAQNAGNDIVGVDVAKLGSSEPALTNLKNLSLAVETGTAQAGAATTITLATGASAVDDFYIGRVIELISGTGAKQARRVTDYVGATRVATIDTAWSTNPSSDTVYQLLGHISAA